MEVNPFEKSDSSPEALSPKEEPLVETTFTSVEPKVEVAPAEETKVAFHSEPEHSKILREHGGMESNIPIGHLYWRIRP